MNIVPSANAPTTVTLHLAEPIPLAVPVPSTVMPTPVGSANNVSVQVSVDTAAATSQPPRDLLSHLTRGDREVIAAATGVQLTSSDMVTEARSGGVPPWGLIMAIAQDRKSGALKGEITPQYLSAVFARHANEKMPFHPQYLDAALMYLRAHSPGAPAPAPTATSGGTVNVFS